MIKFSLRGRYSGIFIHPNVWIFILLLKKILKNTFDRVSQCALLDALKLMNFLIKLTDYACLAFPIFHGKNNIIN